MLHPLGSCFMLQAEGMTLHAVGTGAVKHAVCIVGHRAQRNKLSKTNSARTASQFTMKLTCARSPFPVS